MKYKYFVPDDGKTIEDAIEITYERCDYKTSEWITHDQFSEDDHEYAVEYAAKDHYKRSRPDWNDGDRKIVVVDENGLAKTFDVMLEYEPTFGATERK